MTRSERAGRALAMDTQAPRLAVDYVLFEFRDVVAYVIDQRHAELALANRKGTEKSLLGQMHHDLPIAPGEVRSRRHRAEIRLTLRRFDRHRRELPVGQLDCVIAHRLADQAQIVVAGLMTEAARAGMNQHHHLPEFDAERARGFGVVDFVDAAALEEMISRAERTELFVAALKG